MRNALGHLLLNQKLILQKELLTRLQLAKVDQPQRKQVILVTLAVTVYLPH
jgi:hypothetical protein